MYLVPSSSPTLSSSPTIVPMQPVDSYGTSLSPYGGGVKVSLFGYYRVHVSLQVNASDAGMIFVGAAVNGATPVVAANSAYTPSAMDGIIIQSTAVIHLNSGDVVYVGGEAPGQATVVQSAPASWMAIEGPI
jgi:hypothetical protein